MRRTVLYKFFFAVLVCAAMDVLQTSCSVKKSVCLNRIAIIDETENKVVLWDKTFFQVNPMTMSLTGKDLLCKGAVMDGSKEGYVGHILKDCRMSGDSVAIILPGTIVIDRQNGMTDESDYHYLYCYNFESGQWEIWNRGTIENDIRPGFMYPFYFLRSVILNQKEKRVVIKDVFKDKIVLYVVQKYVKGVPYFTTTVWNPSDMSQLFTVTDYVEENINPISFQIAKSMK